MCWEGAHQICSVVGPPALQAFASSPSALAFKPPPSRPRLKDKVGLELRL